MYHMHRWRRASSLVVRRSLATRVAVDDALESQVLGQSISVFGWVTSVRKQKDLTFVSLSDGSSPSHLQLLAPTDSLPYARELNIGCSVVAEGSIVESTHPSQRVELQVRDLKILGECDPTDYPFKARVRHPSDYVRGFPHLRARTNQFSSFLRARHAATMAIHEFFNQRGFIHCHTPILSSSDCEGAGEMFEVRAMERGIFLATRHFWTVSGQLHAEALMSGLSSVYTFGPTFRAEKSHTRKHLAEFYMVEAETVTLGDPSTALQSIMKLIEDLICSTASTLLERSGEDMKLLVKRAETLKVPSLLANDIATPFKRIPYSEAIGLLQDSRETFDLEPKWGCDLSGEHEQYLLAHCGHTPLFVTDFPASVKPFYAKCNQNSDTPTVASVDLLLPGVGEIVGGTLREDRYDILKDKLQCEGKLEQYQWYLDLRQFGSVPHGGFGLGLERLLQGMLGLENIRDAIPSHGTQALVNFELHSHTNSYLTLKMNEF